MLFLDSSNLDLKSIKGEDLSTIETKAKINKAEIKRSFFIGLV